MQQHASTNNTTHQDEARAATFFLELGLKSMAGKNFSAALQRLGRCKELLIAAADGACVPNAKLGAVCGSQVTPSVSGFGQVAAACDVDTAVLITSQRPVESGSSSNDWK